MGRKVLYLGDGSWCYTENCRRHQEGIRLQQEFVKLVEEGNFIEADNVASLMSASPENREALLRTKVQQMKKNLGRTPTIGLDFDGTVADFTHGLRTHLGVKYSIPKEEWENRFPDPDEYAYYEGSRPWFRDLKHFLSEFQEAEKNGLYRNLRLVDSPNSTLQRLRGYGFNIVGTTARTDIYNSDTIGWLKKKRIPVDKVIHTGPRKSHIQNIEVFIEDSPKVLSDLYENKRPAIIKTQEYNKNQDSPSLLSSRINKWDKNTSAEEVVNLAFKNNIRAD